LEESGLQTWPTLEDFFNDDGSQFLQIGELQLIKERFRRYRGRAVDESILRDFERTLARMENICALLYTLLERE
jgi:hypothetical protein